MPYNEKSKLNLLQNAKTKEEKKAKYSKAKEKASETIRKKREAKEVCLLLLNLPTKGKLDENLKELGFPIDERTNLAALFGRLFTMAIAGDLKAWEMMLKYAGYDPEMNRKLQESAAKIKAIENGIESGFGDSDSEDNDVIIVLPENNRNITNPDNEDKEDNGAKINAPFIDSSESVGDGE